MFITTRTYGKALTLVFACLFSFLVLSLIFRDNIHGIPARWHGPFISIERKPSQTALDHDSSTSLDHTSSNGAKGHPIEDLLKNAGHQFKTLIGKRTYGLSQAARAYRKRRRRHPPPHFDRWVEFAETHDCLVIEDVFDQIYHDLNPFWGMPAEQIRAASAGAENWIRIRDGKVTRSERKQAFISQWFDLIQQLAAFLPDMDIPINTMDESRIIVPWDQMNTYMNSFKSSLSNSSLTKTPSIESFGKTAELENTPSLEPTWIKGGSYWNIVKEACPPETLASAFEQDTDFSTPPSFPSQYPNGTYHGFASNWTLAKDPCYHPHLRNLHGTFVEPISLKTSVELRPIFGGSKLPVNNDILFPAAVYWSEEHLFEPGNDPLPWSEKRDEVFWRGSGTGGRNKESNWKRFHRHRLVSMLNDTQVERALYEAQNPIPFSSQAEARGEGDNQSHDQSSSNVTHLSNETLPEPITEPLPLPQNFPLPNDDLYPLNSHSLGVLPQWLRRVSNVAFTYLVCFPATGDWTCPYSGPWYSRGDSMRLDQMYQSRYLLDVDGNSFSGRYLAFLRSNSLPIKASIYSEWHDSRLIPWKHFVPMDNSFVDIWSILEFFMDRRNNGKGEAIATDGRRWAEMVLRKEDMLAYVYRLLLEYARLGDERREEMGFGGEL
ncbi:MAG: hypothetical protein Q9227_004885 [Pyrenula ochraceoflavens]